MRLLFFVSIFIILVNKSNLQYVVDESAVTVEGKMMNCNPLVEQKLLSSQQGYANSCANKLILDVNINTDSLHVSCEFINLL